MSRSIPWRAWRPCYDAAVDTFALAIAVITIVVSVVGTGIALGWFLTARVDAVKLDVNVNRTENAADHRELRASIERLWQHLAGKSAD